MRYYKNKKHSLKNLCDLESLWRKLYTRFKLLQETNIIFEEHSNVANLM